MKIADDFFYVSGTYYLKGEISSNKTLVYPFPVDPLYGNVDSVYFFNLTSNEIIIPQKTNNKSSVFKIDFGKNNKMVIQASYRQKLLSNKAEYILKTTMAWKKPLEQANYQLIIPANIRITTFSISPQDSVNSGKEVIYYWEKHNYMPGENMIFEFTYEPAWK